VFLILYVVLTNSCRVSEWTLSSDGINSRKKLWNELTEVLETAQPGILVDLGDTPEVTED